MSAPNDPQVTLVSTTDSLAAVQAALGVTPEAAAAVVPPVEKPAAEAVVEKPTETPAAEVPAAVVTEPAKPKGAKQAGSLQGRIDELVRERDTARGTTAARS